MGDREGDAARRLDREQRIIEYALAIIIPTMLALMLFCFFIAPEAFQPMFVLTVLVATLMVVPAYRALRLHYQCWAKNTMPQRVVTGLVGMIYISTASVFGASLISASKGFNPEQPLTFAIIVSFLIGLIGIMAYNSKNRDRFDHMDIRYYRRPSDGVEGDVRSFLQSSSEDFVEERKGRRSVLRLNKRKVTVTIASQPGRSSEVIIECAELSSEGLCQAIKHQLDRSA